MRVLMVDDERLAQTSLTDMLAARSDVEYFATASDAREALEKLEESIFDLVLLDNEMPVLSRTAILNCVRERGHPLPSIVLLSEGEVGEGVSLQNHATDYLSKPFSQKRIEEILYRHSRRSGGERAPRAAEEIPESRKVSPPQFSRIAIKTLGRILFVNSSDLVSVQAEGKNVLLQRESGSYFLRESISAVAEKLRPYGFIRIHRSVLVNAVFVEEIKPYSTGEYGLCVKGGKEYTVTRTYKNNLKHLADFWIGAPFAE
jgi:two-component system LytT family response regulator